MKNVPKKINITLQDVLEVTEEGFVRMDKEFNGIRGEIAGIKDIMATKSDIALLEEKMATKDDIKRIENRFERRIEILEDDVRVLKTTMEKK